MSVYTQGMTPEVWKRTMKLLSYDTLGRGSEDGKDIGRVAN